MMIQIVPKNEIGKKCAIEVYFILLVVFVLVKVIQVNHSFYLVALQCKNENHFQMVGQAHRSCYLLVQL